MNSAFSYLALAGISAHVSSVAFVDGTQGGSSVSASGTTIMTVDDTRVRRSVTFVSANNAANAKQSDPQA